LIASLFVSFSPLGGRPSEFKLSRMLNGIEPMTNGVEIRIEKYLSILEQSSNEMVSKNSIW